MNLTEEQEAILTKKHKQLLKRAEEIGRLTLDDFALFYSNKECRNRAIRVLQRFGFILRNKKVWGRWDFNTELESYNEQRSLQEITL